MKSRFIPIVLLLMAFSLTLLGQDNNSYLLIEIRREALLQDRDLIIQQMSLSDDERAKLREVIVFAAGTSGGLILMNHFVDVLERKGTAIAGSRILTRLNAAGAAVGILVGIEAASGLISEGEFYPISEFLYQAFSIRTARAATLGDHYLSSEENFRAFLNLESSQAGMILLANEELAQVLQLFGEAIRFNQNR